MGSVDEEGGGWIWQRPKVAAEGRSRKSGGRVALSLIIHALPWLP